MGFRAPLPHPMPRLRSEVIPALPVITTEGVQLVPERTFKLEPGDSAEVRIVDGESAWVITRASWIRRLWTNVAATRADRRRPKAVWICPECADVYDGRPADGCCPNRGHAEVQLTSAVIKSLPESAPAKPGSA